MDPRNVSVFEIFERDQRYVVPLFQRPYVWNEEKQWKPLWEDITTKANEYLAYEARTGSEPNKHFLGAVVLNPMRTVGLQVATKLIIDGQQRLTTLQVILLALRDYSQAAGHVDLQRDLEKFTFNACRKEQTIEGYKVWPTNADQCFFEDIFHSKSPLALLQKYPLELKKNRRTPEPRPRLVEAYLYFHKEISDYVKPDLDSSVTEIQSQEVMFSRLDALEQAFKRYLEIVTIDLNEHDNPQVIFQSLNYRGEPLTPTDLIRNFVFFEANKQKINSENLYNQYWFEYDRAEGNGSDGFWKQSEKAGRNLWPRMDLFVFHYLTMQTRREVPLGRLYKEFGDWWSSESRDVSNELKILQEYSKVFKTFYKPNLHTRLGIFERRLRIMDYSTVYPLLLYIFQTRKDEISPEDQEGIVIDLESFLIRRLVCDLSPKNYNKFFLSVLSSLHQMPTVNRKAVQSLLLQFSSETNQWPNDVEFEQSWLSKPVYVILRQRAKMILEALDLQMLTNHQEQVHIDFDKVSIEHIMPQSWQAHYPFPSSARRENEQVRNATRDNLINTFGNLTLLTQPLNNSVSNGPFKMKRRAIAEQSVLRLNVFFQRPRDNEEWMEVDIVERGKTYSKLPNKFGLTQTHNDNWQLYTTQSSGK
jgi:uncharacterized protein with ParB-like and HNH nuclease domain